jgi:hypothetical protein
MRARRVALRVVATLLIVGVTAPGPFGLAAPVDLVGPALAEDVDAAATPAPVTLRASASPEQPTVGSHNRYELEILAPPGVEIVVAQPSERIGDLDIVDFGSSEPKAAGGDGGDAVSFLRWWTLVAWSTGPHLVASPEVSYRLPGGELQAVPPVETTITVVSLLEQAKDASDIRDIKPPVVIPIDWRPYYAIAAALALLVALVLLLRWLAKRRRQVATATPPLPPHMIALGALDALRARRLIEKGAIKEYYSALTDIVRVYLEGRYRVRAPEMTTEEFLVATSRDGRLGAEHRRLLGNFLGESDLVKFARYLPSTDDSERAFSAARKFVEETRETPKEEESEAG